MNEEGQLTTVKELRAAFWELLGRRPIRPHCPRCGAPRRISADIRAAWIEFIDAQAESESVSDQLAEKIEKRAVML